MKDCKIVKTEVANLYKDCCYSSEVISQALIWENLEILEFKNNWYRIKQWDNYISWIHNSYLVDSEIYINNNLHEDDLWYRIFDRLVIINSLENNNEKYLSFGSVIPVIDKENDLWVHTLMPNGSKYKIRKKKLLPCTEKAKIKDLVKYALNNFGAPYVWGGKSGYGYDCSGFIQSLYRFSNIVLPRDCKEQIKDSNLKKIDNDFQIGDLIYFHHNNEVVHVGMLINNKHFIHSSGDIKINSIFESDDNYDNMLFNKIYGVYRYIE